MIRKNAIKITSKLVGDAPIISANGFISRDLFEVQDKPSNFYMIGSMGLASSIALGVAIIATIQVSNWQAEKKQAQESERRAKAIRDYFDPNKRIEREAAEAARRSIAKSRR